MSELRSCPFCGGFGEIESMMSDEYFVCCQDVDCEAESGAYITKESAIAAWNRRAPEAGQPELVENLAMLLRRFISLSRPIDESSALQNLSKQALDFLARHSLSGNPLRDMAAESEARPEAAPEPQS